MNSDWKDKLQDLIDLSGCENNGFSDWEEDFVANLREMFEDPEWEPTERMKEFIDKIWGKL